MTLSHVRVVPPNSPLSSVDFCFSTSGSLEMARSPVVRATCLLGRLPTGKLFQAVSMANAGIGMPPLLSIDCTGGPFFGTDALAHLQNRPLNPFAILLNTVSLSMTSSR